MASMNAILKALPLALIVSGGGFAAGLLEKTTAMVIFAFLMFRQLSSGGGGGSAETEALVGKKAPDFSLTDPVSGKVGSLVKDYVAMAKPIVLDFYQSF
jgi:hypothetical protein